MEKIENIELGDEKAKLFFQKFSKDGQMTESEFYNAAALIIEDLKAGSDWIQKLKDEMYFHIFLKSGELNMREEAFIQAYNELKLLAQAGDNNDDENFDIDFSL
jgi:hypothetical protein